MATTTLKFSKIGVEDLEIGTGTFEVELSDGRKATLNRVNLSSFISPTAIDRSVYFTNGTSIGQDSDFFYNTTTKQFTLANASSTILIGGSGTGSRMVHLSGTGDTGLRIDNGDIGAGDAILEWATHGVVDWHAYLDDSDNDNLKIGAGTVGSGSPHLALMRVNKEVIIGDDTANANMTTGLTINQGAADDEILAFKSSDIAHGMTSLTETDTYAEFKKLNATLGGLFARGYSETTVGVRITGFVTTEDTTGADSSAAAVQIQGGFKSGTTFTSMGATANVASINNSGDAVVLFKGDGDVYNSGGSTTMTTYDDYDDIKLLEAAKGVMDVNFRGSLGAWVDEHLEILERGGVIARGDSGKWFISQRGITGLIVDSIRQLASRLAAVEAGGAAGA